MHTLKIFDIYAPIAFLSSCGEVTMSGELSLSPSEAYPCSGGRFIKAPDNTLCRHSDASKAIVPRQPYVSSRNSVIGGRSTIPMAPPEADIPLTSANRSGKYHASGMMHAMIQSPLQKPVIKMDKKIN